MMYSAEAQKVIDGATAELMDKMAQDVDNMDKAMEVLAHHIIKAMATAVVYDRKDDVERIVNWTKDNFYI